MPPLTLTPGEHIRLAHPPGSRGCPVICRRVAGIWRTESLSVADAIARADEFAGHDDVYLSMQRFRFRRRAQGLIQLGSLHVDLDFYKTEAWSDRSPEQVSTAVLLTLDDVHLPEPSFILFSGRGLQVVWLHEGVPAGARSRWEAAQRQLMQALRPFGADAGASDVARVLRLSGCRNSKSGEMARVLFMGRGGRAPCRWSFDDLVREILPLPRAGIANLHRQTVACRRELTAGERRCTRPSYHETMLADLHRLATFRWSGALPPGHRNDWLLVAASSLAHLHPPAQLEHAINELAFRMAGWSAGEGRSRAAAVLRRARTDGLVTTNQPARQRYRWSARRVIELLGISEQEMQATDLRLLVTPAVAKLRTVQRQRECRRRRGQLPLAAYRDQNADRNARANQMREQGQSWPAIATALGFGSADAARMAAKRAAVHQNPNRSVTVYGGVATPCRPSGYSDPAQPSGATVTPATPMPLACAPAEAKTLAHVRTAAAVGFSSPDQAANSNADRLALGLAPADPVQRKRARLEDAGRKGVVESQDPFDARSRDRANVRLRAPHSPPAAKRLTPCGEADVAAIEAEARRGGESAGSCAPHVADRKEPHAGSGTPTQQRQQAALIAADRSRSPDSVYSSPNSSHGLSEIRQTGGQLDDSPHSGERFPLERRRRRP